MDDTFTADVTVEFTDIPTTGDLILSGPANAPTLVANVSVPVGDISPGATSYVFEGVLISTNPHYSDRQISLTATFSADPNCTLTNNQAGVAKHQCSLECQQPNTGFTYPVCWPAESTLPCFNSNGYAPDPNFPEHTPIRYIKTVLHIFQTEDPANPDNYTEDHLDLFQSWFNDPVGVNGFMADLCDDPTDNSPWMKDSRIRFLNTGTTIDDPNATDPPDVFFHRDNQGWGIGVNNFDTFGSSFGYSYNVKDLYVTGGQNGNNWAPSLSQDYINLMSLPDNQNAFHVFISRGTWIDGAYGTPDGMPSEDDCLQLWPGGFMWNKDYLCDNNSPQDAPVQFVFGSYEAYLRYTLGSDYTGTVEAFLDPRGPATLGKQILGEIFHALSVDHTSPVQAHFNHTLNSDDGCEDTIWESDFNRLGCNFNEDRCALTECQIGRIHQFLIEAQPAHERFPDGNGGYSMTPNLCDITEPTIVVPDGADITWSGPRNLRTNVVVESGGKLTITYDIGMPNGAGFTVKPGGRLIVDGARIYNNCGGKYWKGIDVEGTAQPQFPLTGQGFLRLTAGSTLERAEFPIQVAQGGLAFATQANFINCGLIAFRDYEQHSISRFWGYNFVRDTGFIDLGYWPNQVHLRSVEGLYFSGCSFQTINPDGNTDNGGAIEAFSSKFTVTNSSIEGYRFGI